MPENFYSKPNPEMRNPHVHTFAEILFDTLEQTQLISIQ